MKYDASLPLNKMDVRNMVVFVDILFFSGSVQQHLQVSAQLAEVYLGGIRNE